MSLLESEQKVTIFMKGFHLRPFFKGKASPLPLTPFPKRYLDTLDFPAALPPSARCFFLKRAQLCCFDFIVFIHDLNYPSTDFLFIPC